MRQGRFGWDTGTCVPGPCVPLLCPITHTMASFNRLEEFVQSDVLSVDIIMLLAQLENSMHLTVGNLAGTSGLSPSKMSRLVARLLNAGLIVEHPSQSDARKSDLRISNRGKNVLFEVRQEFGKEALSCTLEKRALLLRIQRTASLTCGARLSFTNVVLMVALSCCSPSKLTVGELGALTLFGQPRISMALRALRKRGLICSTIMPNDRRQRLSQLTAKGHTLIDACANS